MCTLVFQPMHDILETGEIGGIDEVRWWPGARRCIILFTCFISLTSLTYHDRPHHSSWSTASWTVMPAVIFVHCLVVCYNHSINTFHIKRYELIPFQNIFYAVSQYTHLYAKIRKLAEIILHYFCFNKTKLKKTEKNWWILGHSFTLHCLFIKLPASYMLIFSIWFLVTHQFWLFCICTLLYRLDSCF